MTKLKTIFISTGEVSGDMQGALLIEAIKRRASELGVSLEITALGGDAMVKAGATLIGHTSSIGSIGILESLPFLLPTLKIQRCAKQYVQANPPDLVVLIDYMQPNLTLGSYIRRYLPKVPTVYYITPHIWLWSAFAKDTQKIANISDRLLAIFPEEAHYYKERGAQVVWVGHPLVDRMQSAPKREEARAALGIPTEQVAIALLPASRRQEVKYLLPVIFQAAKELQTHLPNVHFWIPLSLEEYRHPIERAIQQYGLKASLIAGRTQTVLAAADLAITKSGTVNLELALLNVPQVVLYRVSPFTFWFGCTFLKFSVPFMSPTNIIVKRAIVPELLQSQATAENIVREAMELLSNPERRQQTLEDYQEMRSCLGEVGVCDRAAKEILQLLS